MCYSKIIVACIIALNAVFTAAVLAVFWHTGAEPGVLVGAWFAFTTGELWALAKIKCKKEEAKGSKPEETKGSKPTAAESEGEND